MCCDSWDLSENVTRVNGKYIVGKPIPPNGKCPDCGEDTIDGQAITGCNYSPVICKTCGDAPCDQSC